MNIKRLATTKFLQKFLKKKRPFVGLDFGSQAIKLVELAEEKVDQLHLPIRYGITDMPLGAFDDGLVKEPAVIAEALKKLMAEIGIPAKTTIVLGVSGKQVFIRQMRLPQMPLDDLKLAVRFEVEKYITMPIEQLFLDFTILEEINADDVPSYNLLVAAAPQKMIYHLCQTVQNAGLVPLAIDVEPLALYRLWHIQNYDQQFKNQMIINIGHTNSHLVVFKGDAIKFTRIIPTAGNQLTEAIIQVSGKETAAAEEKKRSQKLIHISHHKKEMPAVNQHDEQVMQVIAEVVSGLTSEFQRSIDFYQMQAKVRLEQLIITGGTANLAGLASYMEAELGLPVLVGRYGELDPIYSLASGLAVREFVEI